MLQSSTLTFLTDLKVNNHKSWLEAHRPAYEAARADFLRLATAVLNGLRDLDADLARAPLEAKSCVFAQHRDIRFSADKSPYKTNLSAWFNAGGKKAPTAGYFLSIEPGQSFVAGGLYAPEPKTLALIRQEIDYNLADFDKIVQAPSFQTYCGSLQQTDALKRPPKGYEADNPAAEYLKLKSFTGSHSLPDAQLTKSILTAHVLAVCKSLQPLVQYLNRATAQPA